LLKPGIFRFAENTHVTLIASVRRVGTVTPEGCAVNRIALPSVKAWIRVTNCYCVTFSRDRQPLGIRRARNCSASVEEKSGATPKRTFSFVSG